MAEAMINPEPFESYYNMLNTVITKTDICCSESTYVNPAFSGFFFQIHLFSKGREQCELQSSA
jgi:hypothetical protein